MKRNDKRIHGTTPEIERLTQAEVKLWQALKNRQLGGLRFRCQYPIGRFIVDFYCPACKLVVEVDGEIHQYQQDYDVARTEQLKEYGLQLMVVTPPTKSPMTKPEHSSPHWVRAMNSDAIGFPIEH